MISSLAHRDWLKWNDPCTTEFFNQKNCVSRGFENLQPSARPRWRCASSVNVTRDWKTNLTFKNEGEKNHRLVVADFYVLFTLINQIGDSHRRLNSSMGFSWTRVFSSSPAAAAAATASAEWLLKWTNKRRRWKRIYCSTRRPSFVWWPYSASLYSSSWCRFSSNRRWPPSTWSLIRSRSCAKQRRPLFIAACPTVSGVRAGKDAPKKSTSVGTFECDTTAQCRSAKPMPVRSAIESSSPTKRLSPICRHRRRQIKRKTSKQLSATAAAMRKGRIAIFCIRIPDSWCRRPQCHRRLPLTKIGSNPCYRKTKRKVNKMARPSRKLMPWPTRAAKTVCTFTKLDSSRTSKVAATLRMLSATTLLLPLTALWAPIFLATTRWSILH